MNHFENLPFYWINRLSALSRRELTGLFEAAGHKISAEEWAILLVLWGDGPQSPSGLSNKTIKDRTTVTRLIDGMVRKGLVERHENTKDRRRSDIVLTEHGTALKAQLLPLALGLIQRATAGISEEDISTTIRTLRAFTQNLTSQEP